MNETFQSVPSASLPRVDLYVPIHKALRHFMADTMVHIGAMDSSDSTEVRQALDQLGGLLDMLLAHLRHENALVHPAIEARRPGGTLRVAGEHDEHLASIEALQAEAAALDAAAPAQRAMLADRLYRHLALFVAENLQHMHFEEAAHNPLLWSAYGDDELLGVHAEIIGQVQPHEMAAALYWMAPSLSHGELAGMLGGMQAQMPAPAFAAVLEPLRSRLSAARWAKLSAALLLPQPRHALEHI